LRRQAHGLFTITFQSDDRMRWVDLETERLRLTPWCDADTPYLAALGAKPEVTRYVGDGQPWTAQRSRRSSDRVLAHWHDHGFGWRVAVEKATGHPVGFIALNFVGEGMPDLGADEYEIGWWFDPPQHGRGLATEAALAVRDEALHRLRAPSLVARIQPLNGPSRRLAERLGMAVEFETVGLVGEPVLVYRLRP
jgi:RimJ/RimL family protein N-acetyltransferase